ncbi:MAG TPA: hypothetical protein VH351_14170 [Bryobacteraceae bacterium]|jgi:hypothetical protein|nr:hypothetical protein [Bryobacteraceae bacterium]
MDTAQTTLEQLTLMSWGPDWLWGLPLIALTMGLHAMGLLVIGQTVHRFQINIVKRCGYHLTFVVITGSTAALAAILHGIEGAIWAIVYLFVGAVLSYPHALLYSLGAMTTYGHSTLVLKSHWQFLGTLEALNGMLLFGLTTAFLFAIIQKTWERFKSSEPDSPMY